MLNVTPKTDAVQPSGKEKYLKCKYQHLWHFKQRERIFSVEEFRKSRNMKNDSENNKLNNSWGVIVDKREE